MSDHDVETFESADAGASTTFPQQAGTIRKNAYIVINGFPCKVMDVSTSKTGKHGHAKCHFVGVDIFTGKKYEELTPSTHNCDVPNISRKEYTLVEISNEGFLSLMDESGHVREDLQLPNGTEESIKLSAEIKEKFAAGAEIQLSVLKAMNIEMVNAIKVSNATS